MRSSTELENIKKNQTEILGKNTMTELKNSLSRELQRQTSPRKRKNSDLKDRSIEIIQ